MIKDIILGTNLVVCVLMIWNGVTMIQLGKLLKESAKERNALSNRTSDR